MIILQRWEILFLQTWNEMCLSLHCVMRDATIGKSHNWTFSYTFLQERGYSLVCILRWMLRLELWVNVFLLSLHQNGRSAVRTLRCWFRLERWVYLSDTPCTEEVVLLWVHCDAILGLWVLRNVSKWDIVSLPLALVWSSISLKSHLTSLCVSYNTALPSPRRSPNLIFLMKCAASVWVAFNSTLWKDKKLYQDLQWNEADRYFAVVRSPVNFIPVA
jgi:hypothetical protein